MRSKITVNEFSWKEPTECSLLLKRWQIEDAPAVFEAVDRNRGHLERWLPWVGTTRNIEDSADFIRESVKAFERRIKFEYGIFLRPKCNSPKLLLVGAIGLLNGSLQGNLEVGYWLVKDMEGHGIVTMSVKALIEEATNFLGNSHFVIRAHFDNWKSRKIAERLGFVEKGFNKDEKVLQGFSSKMTEYHLD